MNCINHPEAEVSAYCRTCGKPLCVDCKREAGGTVVCAEHVPVAPEPEQAAAPPVQPPPVQPPPVQPPPPFAGSPYSAPPYSAPSYQSSSAAPPPPGGSAYVHAQPGSPSPALAFVLGFAIPGVGAVYNGQYAKGLVHAVVFGLLVSILSSGHAGNFEPVFGILLAIWIFYMAFEAYHTAMKRRTGQKVDELSSLVNIPTEAAGVPVGPVVLIGLGVVFLLDTLNLISFDRVVRYWPVLLIVGGAYMLYTRIEGRTR